MKTAEITKKEARAKIVKAGKGAIALTLLCLMLWFVSIFVPAIPNVFSMMLVCVGVVGVLVGLAILMVISFAKSEIRALNILYYGFKKFTLKEVKDE